MTYPLVCFLHLVLLFAIVSARNMEDTVLAYCFVLEAKDVDLTHIGNEIRAYRKFFVENNIRGSLLYDGEYFVNMLVGDALSIIKAEHAMDASLRNTKKDILFYGKATEDFCGFPPVWQVGYLATHTHMADIDALREAKGDIAQLVAITTKLKEVSDAM